MLGRTDLEEGRDNNTWQDLSTALELLFEDKNVNSEITIAAWTVGTALSKERIDVGNRSTIIKFPPDSLARYKLFDKSNPMTSHNCPINMAENSN